MYSPIALDHLLTVLFIDVWVVFAKRTSTSRSKHSNSCSWQNFENAMRGY
jgi:hypothetical protein